MYAIACLTVDSTKITKVSRISIVSRTTFFACERSYREVWLIIREIWYMHFSAFSTRVVMQMRDCFMWLPGWKSSYKHSVKDDAKLPLYSASSVWCPQFQLDFYTLLMRGKQRIVYACRAAASGVQYVYAFRNYPSEFLQQSGTPPSAAWRHFNRPFGNLPGFEDRRAIHQNTFQK